ncbi:MAG: lipid-A-disaccharide synthase [Candidatus Kapabacteria bacterium]|nr:lipid-A-disaccharide synthase [Candidatus Kapabacteria bacterium]MCX7936180.1 lipid-A-disaccharide synthase [Chlorobiota bacterium]
MSLRVFIVAGDRSGDNHAARLMQAIKDREPTAVFTGIGGTAMIEAGLVPLMPFEHMNVSGFWEVLRRYRLLRAAFDTTLHYARTESFDLFIPVDYPGFNLPLARDFRRRGIPVFWYIAPQLWAWGQWRARQLAEAVDRLFVVLPFEVEFFRRMGIPAEFYGHPFMDDPAYAQPPAEEKEPFSIALLPGSRAHERALHYTVMLEIAHRLHQKDTRWQFLVATEPSAERNIPPYIHFLPDAKEVLHRARYGLIKAGTSTLEAMLANVAQVTMYRASLGTYVTARMLVKIPFVALPNIVLGEKVVPEIVQWTARTGKILRALEELMGNPQQVLQQHQAAQRIRSMLGASGVSARIADRILTLLGRA